MFHSSKHAVAFGSLILVIAGISFAQQSETPAPSSFRLNLPPNAPVSLVDMDLGQSRQVVRGAATVLDLHMTLTLRNTGSQVIRAVTLLVSANETASGGRGAVTRPLLHAIPGDTFAVPVDVRLVRPVSRTPGPQVQISLDGVLFQGFSFFGPNNLNSRRSMTGWELEADRDRAHFLSILAKRGEAGLRQAIVESLARQQERPSLNVSVSRGPAAGWSAAVDTVLQFAFLDVPEAPVQTLNGFAEVEGDSVRSPRVNIRNTSSKPVRHVEIGWLVKDGLGREFSAGSLPAADWASVVPPGGTGSVLQDTSLRFSQGGASGPVQIRSVNAFVSEVEFADGQVWIPPRRAFDLPSLRLVPPSAEEERLIELYRAKGLPALIQELKKYQ